MSSMVAWNLQLTVRSGHLDELRQLMAEMVRGAREEVGALGYEWFLDSSGSTCHINERYVDSDAVLAHLGNFATNFSDRFMACLQPTSLTVYGEPSDEVRAALDGFGAAYLGTFGGFTRPRSS